MSTKLPVRGPAHRHHPQWFRLTRLHALRTRRKIHSHRHISLAYRWTVGIVGTALILLGLALVPLPGPGWLVVFSGIAVISTEFAWARRLLHWARATLQAWKEWLLAHHWTVSAGVSLATCLFVCACVWLVLHLTGLPDWVPAWLAHATALG